MPSLKVEIVTAERVVYSDDVDAVIAPGAEGQLGILPYHAPLMTALQPGELVVRKAGQEDILAISGGFMEVRPDRVIILADSAERAEEIDVERAEAARKRAEDRTCAEDTSPLDMAQCEAALKRAVTRLEVAQKLKKRRKL